MKKIYALTLSLIILFTFCSCDNTKQKSETGVSTEQINSSASTTEGEILGTWEITINGNTNQFVFQSNGKGQSVSSTGNVLKFEYNLLNDHEIRIKQKTIDGEDRDATYEYKLSDNTLLLDGMEYTRK